MSDRVFLDTETTGIGPADEVIEIAVVDAQGHTLVDERIWPTVEIDPEAEIVHGIGPEALADAPQWPEIEGKVRAALEGNQVVIFNASFDVRILHQTIHAFLPSDQGKAAYDASVEWFFNLDVECAMAMAARCYGATNRYGSISLVDAVDAAGISWRGEPHSAAGDAATSVALVAAIEQQQAKPR